MIADRCPFLPFYPYAECVPESRRHFWASRNAIRSPDGTFWRQEMQSGVPTAFFGVRKCNPESRRRFLASGNAIRGPDGIFWRQEMQSGVPTAISGVSDRQKMSMGKGFQGTKILSHFACRITVPLLWTAGRLGWTIRLVISSMPYQVASYHSSSFAISSATLPTLVTLPLRTSSAARNKVPFRFAPGKKLLFLMFNTI